MLETEGGCQHDTRLEHVLDLISQAVNKIQPRKASLHFLYFLLGFGACLAIWGLWSAHVWRARTRRRLRRELSGGIETLSSFNLSKLRTVLGNVGLPRWISFPDFERVDWLNEVVAQLWPHIDKAVSASIVENIEPMLKDMKPSWITSIQFSRFTLGSKPPIMTGVKVFRGAPGKSESPEEVIIDADVLWGGNQDVILAIQPFALKVGVEKLIMSSKMRFVLRPLMPEIPIVAAFKVSFVETPFTSFNLHVLGGDISHMPFLEGFLASTLGACLEPYTLPGGYLIPLIVGDLPEEKAREAVGTLSIILHEGRNIPKTDLFSHCDPYIEFSMPGSSLRHSSVIKNSANPKWPDEAFRFVVHDETSEAVTVTLYDHDRFSKNDVMGSVKLYVRDVPADGRPQQVWLNLPSLKRASKRSVGLRESASANKPIEILVTVKYSRQAAAQSTDSLPAAESLKPSLEGRPVSSPPRLGVTGIDPETKRSLFAELGGIAAHVHGVPAPEQSLAGGILICHVGSITNIPRQGWRKGNRKIKVLMLVRGTQLESKAIPMALTQSAAIEMSETLETALQPCLPGQDNNITVQIVNSKNASLGSVVIPLAGLIASSRISNEYPLAMSQNGTIHLDLTWMADSAVASAPLEAVPEASGSPEAVQQLSTVDATTPGTAMSHAGSVAGSTTPSSSGSLASPVTPDLVHPKPALAART